MKMRAVRWYGIRDVRTEEIEKPSPAPGEVLVRILYAGICGSDLHIYKKGMFIQNVPETMGHEFCGIAEDVSQTVNTPGKSPADSIRRGDIVVANPMVPCGTCESCRRGDYNTCDALGFIGEVRQGCFTRYICLPEDRLIRVPAPARSSSDTGPDGSCVSLPDSLAQACLSDSIPPSDLPGSGDLPDIMPDASEWSEALLQQLALTEPLAVAVNICRRAGIFPAEIPGWRTAIPEKDPEPSRHVGADIINEGSPSSADISLAIIGAGPIGLLTAALAKQVCGLGDVTVVNRSETRRHIAAELSAKAVSFPADGIRFDKVVEAAGTPETLRLALSCTRAGGQVLAVSVFEDGDCSIDANLLVGSQITLTGCNCYTTQDLQTAARLITSRKINTSPIITDIVSLDEGKASFEKLCAPEKKAAKILFRA